MHSGPVPPVHGAGIVPEPLAIIEQLPVAICATDADGWITFFNAGAASLWGRSPLPGEARFCGALRLFGRDGDPLPFEAAPIARSLAERAPRPAEVVIERPDGSRIVVDVQPGLIVDATGRISGATAVLTETTALFHHRDDEAGRRRDEIAARRLAAIVESSDDAILAKDLHGIITDFNQGAERLLGYAAAEVIGKPVTMLIPPERVDEEPQILDRIRRGERIEHYETVRRRKDGSVIDISLAASPIRTPDGTIIGASTIARDITERRRLEERQQLLLREMNHRVKNLFALAGSLVSLSARQVATAQELASLVGERLAALARAHDLTLSKVTDGGTVTMLHALIGAILSPFDGDAGADRRVRIAGDDLPVAGSAVTGLALLLHEFATNAAKYGALSTIEGSVAIETSIAGDQLELDWREQGGPALAAGPSDEGFGSVLVRATARGQLGGAISRQFEPAGLTIRLTVPLARLGAGPAV